MSTILIWASNFAPINFAFCDGSILSISTNNALYSLLGTNYGGNGTTTFGLPDLRGRVPIGSNNMGIGPGLSSYNLGNQGGLETVALTSAQSSLPAHNHTLNATSTTGSSNTPSNTVTLATPPNIVITTNNKPVNIFATPATGTLIALNTQSIGANAVTNGTAHENRMPYQALNYIICTAGIYPSRQ